LNLTSGATHLLLFNMNHNHVYTTHDLCVLKTLYSNLNPYFVVLLQYLAAGVLPLKLPTPCINLSFLSLTINFDNMEEISAALCVFRSSPNLQKLKISVSTRLV